MKFYLEKINKEYIETAKYFVNLIICMLAVTIGSWCMVISAFTMLTAFILSDAGFMGMVVFVWFGYNVSEQLAKCMEWSTNK